MHSDLLYLIALSQVKNLGPVGARNLLAFCGGTAEAVFKASPSIWAKTPGIGKQTIASLRSAKTLQTANRELNYCKKNGISILSFRDPAYPKQLLFIHNAPLVLYKTGKVNLNAQIAIGIVGTRKATAYGKEITTYFASHLAKAGINIVSGLAYGIDIYAHKEVLKQGGTTTAVLGSGLNHIYPHLHRATASSILSKGGLITEYLSGIKPEAPYFPARNRIIAGICKAVIVVEAGIKGGALITAKQAFDQNREVYAVPGRIGDLHSAGCNRLIRDNIAKAITDPQEILDDLSIKWNSIHPQPEQSSQLSLPVPANPPLTSDEAKVLNFLHGEALELDRISYKTGIPLKHLNHLLLSMEFKGLLAQEPGKRFRKSTFIR